MAQAAIIYAVMRLLAWAIGAALVAISITALCIALSGCADLSHYRKGDDCAKCYAGLGQVLGTQEN